MGGRCMCIPQRRTTGDGTIRPRRRFSQPGRTVKAGGPHASTPSADRRVLAATSEGFFNAFHPYSVRSYERFAALLVATIGNDLAVTKGKELRRDVLESRQAFDGGGRCKGFPPQRGRTDSGARRVPSELDPGADTRLGRLDWGASCSSRFATARRARPRGAGTAGAVLEGT